MRTIKNLPKLAKYDYTDVCGYKHYHTANRIYLVWSNRYRQFVVSYSKKEERFI